MVCTCCPCQMCEESEAHTSFGCFSSKLFDCPWVDSAGIHKDAIFLWGPFEPGGEGTDQGIVGEHGAESDVALFGNIRGRRLPNGTFFAYAIRASFSTVVNMQTCPLLLQVGMQVGCKACISEATGVDNNLRQGCVCVQVGL